VHPSLEFHFINTSEELLAFVPHWQSMWPQDPNATPFQSPEWLVPWWKQFGNEQLCAVVIFRGERAIGLLPFYVYHDHLRRERQLLPLGVGTTDYLDGVFLPECTASEIREAMEFLRSHAEHDVLCVLQLRTDSRLMEAYQQGSRFRDQGSKMADDDRAVSISQSEPCSRMPAVTMPQLPQKIKRNAMYYRNRAQRKGRLELLHAEEGNWRESFEALRRLHSSRWQIRGEEGVLVDERVVAWHCEAIPLLLQAGLLRLMTLRLDDEILAVLYSVIDRERAQRTQYFYITAYSPEYADLRPGTLLIAYAVEQAAREGVATIDMLRGDEAYKEIWHMEKSPTWCITQFASARTTADDLANAAA
jgi:CelD/BcsL family acetyltransferase involved in cellulose biosynthesis